MRILVISSSYPPVLGGLQTAAHALTRHLLGRGQEVAVVTNRYPRSLAKQEILDGVPVCRRLFLKPELETLRSGRQDLLLASLYFYPATLLYLKRLIREFRPDVINVHFPDGQVPFVLWLRQRFPFRLVVSLHGHEVLRWFGASRSFDVGRKLQDSLEISSAGRSLRAVLKEADAVTACSRYLLDKAIQLEPAVAGKGHVIHNGIDLERFADKTPFSHPRPYVLAFGRLTYQKGFDLLLRAFAQVADTHAGVDLIVTGEGEERATLEADRQRLGLEGRVLFTGRASPAEVVHLLNGCLFVVVPSRWEPFGITALEALAAGKPVLATGVGGMREFLEQGERPGPEGDNLYTAGTGRAEPTSSVRTLQARPCALLVEPTVADLREGLAHWLWRRDELELPQANHNWSSRHTWANVARKYLEVYSAG